MTSLTDCKKTHIDGTAPLMGKAFGVNAFATICVAVALLLFMVDVVCLVESKDIIPKALLFLKLEEMAYRGRVVRLACSGCQSGVETANSIPV